jgi:hypothetical protein
MLLFTYGKYFLLFFTDFVGMYLNRQIQSNLNQPPILKPICKLLCFEKPLFAD